MCLKLSHLLLAATFGLGATAALAGTSLNGPNPSSQALHAPSPVGSPFGFSALWAVMNADGTILRSSGGNTNTTQTLKLSTGVYQVAFRRNLSACSWNGTIGFGTFSGSTSASHISVTGRAGNTSAVFVQTFDNSGASADLPFIIQILC